MFSTDEITATGLYLLEILKAEGAVNYSRFYGAAKEIEDALVAGALRHHPPGEPNERCLREMGHVALERAAWQLEAFGVVKVTTLPDAPELIDGEPDFRIELTEAGRKLLAAGHLGFKFRHPRIHGFDASSASEWLVTFLECGGPGQTLTLADVMEFGASDGDVKVKDEMPGNVYPLGTRPYAWAFEVCLWHFVRSGVLEPVFKDDAERAVWEGFFKRAGQHLFRMTDLDEPHPHWDVEFRFRPGVDLRTVRHVGVIGRE